MSSTLSKSSLAADAAPGYELILEAGRAEKHYWADLWRYRELFQVLAWRDVSVRYKQTVIDFLISFSLLVLMMIWYAWLPGWQILLLPVFVALAFLASLGPALWITALNVKYRDFRYIIPFIVQFGLYISPVGFSSSVIPEKWRLLYSINPVVGVIDGFRWCILGESSIYWPGFLASLLVTTWFLWFGIRQFRRMEKSFADLI